MYFLSPSLASAFARRNVIADAEFATATFSLARDCDELYSVIVSGWSLSEEKAIDAFWEVIVLTPPLEF